MRKTSILIILSACLLMLFTLYNRLPIMTAATIHSPVSTTTVPVAFPKDGIEYTRILRGLDAMRNGMPGFYADDPPNALYGKYITRQDADSLLKNRAYVPGSDARDVMWMLILEGHIITYNEFDSEHRQQSATQLIIVFDEKNPDFASFTTLPEQNRLDTTTFTRYALPTPDQYTFPESNRALPAPTPIILDPAPTMPTFKEKGVYPAPTPAQHSDTRSYPTP